MSCARLALAVGTGLLMAMSACRTLDRTADGVAIVPFDAQATPSSTHTFGSAALRFHTEAWTNRMPGPSPRGEDRPGFPLHVALRIEGTGPEGAADALQVQALSLWSPAGDSLWAAFALTRPDGSPPVLGPDDGASTWELTDDRDRPRFGLIAEDARAVPMLLIERDSRQQIIRLPEIRVIAVY